MRNRVGVVFALLVLCAVVCAQTASLSEIHSHQHSAQHCCGLCHAGPLPFVACAIGAGSLPALAVLWLRFADEAEVVRETLASSAASRAPPAWYLS